MPRKTIPPPDRRPSAGSDHVQDFEKLGVFYLGRPYDLPSKQAKPGWVLYDSKDLVTHAVCVGMTGSGKTGLCLALLEEAAIDNIPAIIIDPKGDLGNLLLTFPNLKAEDFQPWINEDDARKKGVSPAEYASQQAEWWKKGLASWQQDGSRIQRLRDAAEFAIYTPGSNAGIPVSIVKSLAAPAADARDDDESWRERINTTVTGLLALLGIEADPIQSREHILLSTIVDHTWKLGKDLDLAALIQAIQQPPMPKIGVMDVDAFFPSKDRFALAMKLNNLLAAPGFQAWLEGDALDVPSLLHTPAGKPRMAIFSIAHLNDAERMFFVTLLLSQMVGWMRAQSGTTSLRALLYMDEIFGYFPPVANPPSKLPLMTLLKQARAFGLGIVLATQNPVDLDYKGLANTGTWFIGRLQTERDKARVLEGLEGASASSGKTFDKNRMEQVLAGLGNRIFLMNNVHEDELVVFESRWCLSYLRGPLTRTQIKALMDPVKREALSANREASGAIASTQTPSRITSHASRPLLPADVPQYFVPLRGKKPEGNQLVYAPMLLASAQVRFVDGKNGIESTRDVTVLTTVSDGPVSVDWDRAVSAEIVLSDLEREPADGAQFLPLPAAAGKAKNYAEWSKDFSGWLFRTQKMELLRSPSAKELSQPGESEREFKIRLQQTVRERRDLDVEEVRRKYEPKKAKLEDQLRKTMQAKERESSQANQTILSTVIAAAPLALDYFLGRRRSNLTKTELERGATVIRGIGRSVQQTGDTKRAEENVAAVQKDIEELDADLQSDMEAIKMRWDSAIDVIEKIEIRPAKANIFVKLVALAWVPAWQDTKGMTSAWQ